MTRRAINVAALTLLIIGVWMLIRFRPSNMGGEAGVAFIENADGSVRLATETRPAERTMPVNADVHGAKVDAHASGSMELVATDDKARHDKADQDKPTQDKPTATAKGTSYSKYVPKGSEKPWLSEFELIERSGKRFSSESLKGQPYVVGFFFATCPSICVRQNEKFKILQDKFRGQPIRLVEISCDPDVDRPEVLAEYANRFEADKDQWLFFTGNMDYISRVGSEMYEIGIMRRAHPEKLALVDASGKIYGYYTWSDAGQWQALQRDMAKLIAETSK